MAAINLVFVLLKGKCISEPNLCRTGVTMIFWANIETSEISADPATSQYVFSSGGYDRRSQGFSLFHKNNSYVLQVVNGRKKWREEIPLSRMPSDCWFSFAFTWSKGASLMTSLKYLVDKVINWWEIL